MPSRSLGRRAATPPAVMFQGVATSRVIVNSPGGHLIHQRMPISITVGHRAKNRSCSSPPSYAIGGVGQKFGGASEALGLGAREFWRRLDTEGTRSSTLLLLRSSASPSSIDATHHPQPVLLIGAEAILRAAGDGCVEGQKRSGYCVAEGGQHEALCTPPAVSTATIPVDAYRALAACPHHKRGGNT